MIKINVSTRIGASDSGLRSSKQALSHTLQRTLVINYA